MSEIIQRDGTWAFDGSTVRITPGLHRSVPLFRKTYGEIAVPLEAVAGIVYETERRCGLLRLRLREGADPLLQATGDRLPETADPYRLAVDIDRSGVAVCLAEEVRRALLLDQIPQEPSKAYLLPALRSRSLSAPATGRCRSTARRCGSAGRTPPTGSSGRRTRGSSP